MAKQKGRTENLIPLNRRTKEQQREIQVKGALAAQEARKKNKLMREMYAEFLEKKYKVKIGGKERTLSGSDICLEMIPKIVLKADASSVSFFKELDRVQMEDLERNRVTDNELKIIIDDGEADADKNQ